MNKLFFVFWFLQCGLLSSASTNSQCHSMETCNSCMKISYCAWCTKINYDGKRCFDRSLNFTNDCPAEYIYNPQSQVTILENRNIENSHIETWSNSDTHIMPQKLQLKLRQGESYELEAKYTLSKRPVDIYYLIDAKSMSIKNRNKIIYFSEELTEIIPKMPIDLKVGFGSFVDKVVAPFVDTSPEKLNNPCQECSAPYGFRHHISMTHEMSRFLSSIRRFPRSGRVSPLNGGLDALMQTLVCSYQIGWRLNSLKYVIFVTDSGAHQEGDGKQANITKLNDQNCHLDNRGYYTYSQLMDYPSTYQINSKAKENDIKIIFAVTESELQTYKNISQDIERSTVIELNSQSIDHVSSLIYNETKWQFTHDMMKHNSSEEIVSIKLVKREYNEKNDLSTYKFNLEAKTCNPNATESSEIIRFHPEGEIDSLIIDLQVICSCDCHKYHLSQENSPYCSNSGTLDCGICQCNENTYGRQCECKVKGSGSECILPNTSAICNGRGACVCGYCECDARSNPEEVIYGKYCECDNFSCDHYDGKLCSGPDHGKCECGQCVCNEGWSGSSCSFPGGPKTHANVTV